MCSSSRSGRTGSTEYKERHARVWPDMLAALAESGWHNYSLFLRDDGLLIGYFETPSLEAAQAGMARTDVNGRWQAEMARFLRGPGRPLARRGVPGSSRRSSTWRTSSPGSTPTHND